MLLNELTRYYDFDPSVSSKISTYYNHKSQKKLGIDIKSDDQLQNSLAKLGWKRAGHGGYSNVFENPSKNYILKVNYYPDSAFAWFALLTRKFPNPHFPKIGNMKYFHLKGKINHYHVYLIEKLHQIPSTYTWYAEYTVFKMITLAAKDSDSKELEEALEDAKDTSHVKGGTIYEYLQKNPKFLDALRIIGICASRNKFSIDLHTENIMARNDGTFVLTDPLAK
ncbi:Uncharacterised protein [uncultured archaeon]|nr:Uncharacterised protein [uncultured archaeon]